MPYLQPVDVILFEYIGYRNSEMVDSNPRIYDLVNGCKFSENVVNLYIRMSAFAQF